MPVPSPDPLSFSQHGSDAGSGSGSDTELGECIVVLATSPKLARPPSPSVRTPSRKHKIQPVVEIPSPRKRQKGDVTTPRTEKIRKVGTPLSRASPTPNGKVRANGGGSIPLSAKKVTGGKGKDVVTTPTKNGRSPIVKLSTKKQAGTPTLGSSLTNPLPTPSPAQQTNRKRPRVSASPSVAKALTFDDEIFDSPVGQKTTDAEITRQAFLANEALKRQREARNFIYKGEASAPKLTRSGRVVGSESVRESEELDEYGGHPEEDEPLGVEAAIVPDVPVHADVPIASPLPADKKKFVPSLPELARPHVIRILSTLNSHGVATNPEPFVDEEKNEALQGLVNLLKGTVERGEGNSALVVGPRGVGKTRTVARALNLLPSTSTTSPIIVRLSGHAQTNDRLAIREMGRQIAEAEGKKLVEGEEEDGEEGGDEEEYAPTTLPSHLLALLTTPSPRAIVIIMEEFDLFTEHARQALLYCLLDVVQSVKTGPVETTGRGVAVIGVTSRVDTLLLLEKRVKSRFSHRVWRVSSPISSEGPGWTEVLRRALIPWDDEETTTDDRAVRKWKGDWQFAVETLLEDDRIKRNLDRLTGLTTDVRNLYRPFIVPMMEVLDSKLDFLSIPEVFDNVLAQIEGAGWGLQTSKIRGLPHPALGVLIIAKHLAYAGREEFNFAQVEEEYLRFSRTKLVGSGKVRWPIGVLRTAYDHLVRLSLLTPASNATVKPQFAKVRSALSPHEIVAWFKGEGGGVLGPELGNWGRMMGGHA
ncbi:hypothetical protein CI109_104309 [Kwoniella shandongensis]|uniref:Uncharacterized protein n=1 Tax=Kwoniella shandongensis TaxID=1734106 RepID=A0A5M6C0X5_9TREE|nr:uncharacterized protein CI109_002788 [Kwoniella shandongensis]KAA5528634.1 hypothetical protein CI109_002788 [Kwoniella shandongensis]